MWHALFQAPAVNCGQDTVPSFMACNLLGKQTLVKEICEIRQGTGLAAGIKMLFGLLLCMFQCLDPSLGCDDSSFLNHVPWEEAVLTQPAGSLSAMQDARIESLSSREVQSGLL